ARAPHTRECTPTRGNARVWLYRERASIGVRTFASATKPFIIAEPHKEAIVPKRGYRAVDHSDNRFIRTVVRSMPSVSLGFSGTFAPNILRLLVFPKSNELSVPQMLIRPPCRELDLPPTRRL